MILYQGQTDDMERMHLKYKKAIKHPHIFNHGDHSTRVLNGFGLVWFGLAPIKL